MITPGSSAGGLRKVLATGSVPAVLGIAMAFVLLTRLPVARTEAFDSVEFGDLDQIQAFRFPMHHTLFMAARVVGEGAGVACRGFVSLDMIAGTSVLTNVWR